MGCDSEHLVGKYKGPGFTASTRKLGHLLSLTLGEF